MASLERRFRRATVAETDINQNIKVRWAITSDLILRTQDEELIKGATGAVVAVVDGEVEAEEEEVEAIASERKGLLHRPSKTISTWTTTVQRRRKLEDKSSSKSGKRRSWKRMPKTRTRKWSFVTRKPNCSPSK